MINFYQKGDYIMYDYHIHSAFSQDSHQSIEQICEKAVELGLKEIVITDHVDKGVLGQPIFNYEKYSEEIKKVIHKYKKDISVKTGIEIGIQKGCIEDMNDLIKNNYFDFIILSVHWIDNVDISELFENSTQKEIYNYYLNNLLRMVTEYQGYNVAGHIDIISRYSPSSDRKLRLEEYQDILDKILLTIINNNKGIEVNTSGYRYGLGDMHPSKEIIKRYRELGGEIITAGSDAHKVEHIGYRIDEVYEFLKDIGFKYITTFKNMETQFIKL